MAPPQHTAVIKRKGRYILKHINTDHTKPGLLFEMSQARKRCNITHRWSVPLTYNWGRAYMVIWTRDPHNKSSSIRKKQSSLTPWWNSFWSKHTLMSRLPGSLQSSDCPAELLDKMQYHTAPCYRQRWCQSEVSLCFFFFSFCWWRCW